MESLHLLPGILSDKPDFQLLPVHTAQLIQQQHEAEAAPAGSTPPLFLKQRLEQELHQQLNKDSALFLQRYGSSLTTAQQALFMPMATDYEIRFHLQALGHVIPADASTPPSNTAPLTMTPSSASSDPRRSNNAPQRVLRLRSETNHIAHDEATNLDDLYDYDKYLETRAACSPKHDSDSTVALPKQLPTSSSNAAQYGSLRQTNSRLESHLSHLHLPPPFESKTLSASQRRSFLLRLLSTSSSSDARSTASDSLEKYGLVTSDWSGYFEDDAMEKRRPLVFHEYIGVYRDALRRHQQQQDDEQEEERMQKKYNQKGQIATTVSSNTTEASLPAPRMSSLPQSLSGLLLANYDRSVLQERRDQEKGARRLPEQLSHIHHAPSRTQEPGLGKPSPSRSIAREKQSVDSMIDSDESELDDDEMNGAASSSSNPLRRDQPRMVFSADDGRVMDDDGSDLREAGATASLEYAEWVREQIEDDMDVQEARREENMARLIQREQAERLRQVREDNENEANENTSGVILEEERKESDGPNQPAEEFQSLDPTSAVFAASASASRSEFLELMRELFLRGYDGEWVNYRSIDENDALEDIKDRESREQEQYFDELDENEQMRE